MALVFSDTLRNNTLDEISALVDAGATGGKLVLYDGVQPAFGGAATNEVATITFATTGFEVAGSTLAGVMNSATTTDDTSATGGTATWFRITQSDNTTAIIDGTVTASGGGGDIELTNTTIPAGITVSIPVVTFTAGNG